MLIIDTELKRRHENNSPIRVALVGAGAIGAGVANQILKYSPGIQLSVVVSRNVENARKAYSVMDGPIPKEVTTANQLDDCIAQGIPVVTSDAFIVCEAEKIDLIFEVVGLVEFGIKLALKAFSCKKDFLTMNAEMDSTVGLALKHRADKAGVVYSLCDGDQPGVLMNLFRQVNTYGLQPLVCGNIKGLEDKRRTPATQASFAKEWNQSTHMVTSFADGTKVSMEQACVANATNMSIECRGMKGGDFRGHLDELANNGRYDVDSLKALNGVVDYVVGPVPSPGVFVFASIADNDPIQQHGLELYKMGKGPLYSFYSPYHLCYLEATSSIARVALYSDTIIAPQTLSVDVITMAKRELKKGEKLDGIGGYMTYGICETYKISQANDILPMGASENCILKHDIPVDQPIKYSDVITPSGRDVEMLRAEQHQLVAKP